MTSMYFKTEMLFPSQAISRLRDLRGKEWQKLIDRVAALPEVHPDKLAFMLLMVHLDGCLDCDADSYRAMRGCELCAQQTIRRFKGADQELLKRFELAKREVLEFLEKQHLGLPKVA
ncbi:MAG: hypothetical protein ACOYZ7_14340 [Chloroflexota bacterium]